MVSAVLAWHRYSQVWNLHFFMQMSWLLLLWTGFLFRNLEDRNMSKGRTLVSPSVFIWDYCRIVSDSKEPSFFMNCRRAFILVSKCSSQCSWPVLMKLQWLLGFGVLCLVLKSLHCFHCWLEEFSSNPSTLCVNVLWEWLSSGCSEHCAKGWAYFSSHTK